MISFSRTANVNAEQILKIACGKLFISCDFFQFSAVIKINSSL